MKLSSAALLCAAALLALAPLAASSQEADAPSELPAIEEATPANPFLDGDQTLQINAGFQFPLFLLPETGYGVDNLKTGGAFSFTYQYFLSRGFAVGGSLTGSFNGTIGDQTVFIAPLGVTAAYWWSKMPLEFCVLGELGGYLMRYNKKGMIGPFAKAGGGAFWRITSSWSLGLQGFLWFVPEFHVGEYADLTQYSGFVETSIAAVYHL